MTFSWNASTDNVGVTNYDVYHDGQQIKSVSGSTLSTSFAVVPNVTWGLYVNARDAAGNVSQASTTVDITPPPCQSDTQPPTAPGNLTGSASGTSVSLSWSASTDNVGVTGYDIFRGSTKAGTVTGTIGVVPSSYLRYFYSHDLVVQEQKTKPSRAAQVAEMETKLLELYADPAVDTKPELLEKRGGAFYSEAAVALIASLLGNRGDVQIVNLRNAGALPFLPDDAIIEVPARITAAGPVPLPIDPVEPLFAGLIAHVSAYESLALEAALHGGRDRVADALLAHPLIGQSDLSEQLTRLLIEANRAHLSWAASR